MKPKASGAAGSVKTCGGVVLRSGRRSASTLGCSFEFHLCFVFFVSTGFIFLPRPSELQTAMLLISVPLFPFRHGRGDIFDSIVK